MKLITGGRQSEKTQQLLNIMVNDTNTILVVPSMMVKKHILTLIDNDIALRKIIPSFRVVCLSTLLSSGSRYKNRNDLKLLFVNTDVSFATLLRRNGVTTPVESLSCDTDIHFQHAVSTIGIPILARLAGTQ